MKSWFINSCEWLNIRQEHNAYSALLANQRLLLFAVAVLGPPLKQSSGSDPYTNALGFGIIKFIMPNFDGIG